MEVEEIMKPQLHLLKKTIINQIQSIKILTVNQAPIKSHTLISHHMKNPQRMNKIIMKMTNIAAQNHLNQRRNVQENWMLEL